VVFCAKCGFEITEELVAFCNKCGTPTSQNSGKKNSSENYMSKNSSIITSERSNWWYLVPILFGIIGGFISYLILRTKSPILAKKCLIVGTIVFAINFLLGYTILPILF
jgi:uncharacterized membrane protein YvbJ